MSVLKIYTGPRPADPGDLADVDNWVDLLATGLATGPPGATGPQGPPGEDGVGGGGSMTGAEILAALVDVDGEDSGLDADLLDGQSASWFTIYADTVTADTINTHIADPADPHGDRSYTVDAVNDHIAAADPHGDRAYADSLSSVQAINDQTGTAYTLVLADAGKLVTFTNTSPITVTVPDNATVAFPVGQRIDLVQLSSGQVSVVGDVAVTINATPGLNLRESFSAASLICYGVDIWVLVGDLDA